MAALVLKLTVLFITPLSLKFPLSHSLLPAGAALLVPLVKVILRLLFLRKAVKQAFLKMGTKLWPW